MSPHSPFFPIALLGRAWRQVCRLLCHGSRPVCATGDLVDAMLKDGKRQRQFFAPSQPTSPVQASDGPHALCTRHFGDTSHIRRANLSLVRDYVDGWRHRGRPGEEVDRTDASRRQGVREPPFCVEIAAELKTLDRTRNCHEDVRVFNLIRGASPVRLIDIDLSGPPGVNKYPTSLKPSV